MEPWFKLLFLQNHFSKILCPYLKFSEDLLHMTKEIQFPLQDCRSLFNLLFHPHLPPCPPPLPCVLCSGLRAACFMKRYHNVSHIWVFVFVPTMLSTRPLANSHLSFEKQLTCSVLWASIPVFPGQLVVWFSVLLCVYFCYSLSHCFIIICLHACLFLNKNIEIGESSFLEGHYFMYF